MAQGTLALLIYLGILLPKTPADAWLRLEAEMKKMLLASQPTAQPAAAHPQRWLDAQYLAYVK